MVLRPRHGRRHDQRDYQLQPGHRSALRHATPRQVVCSSVKGGILPDEREYPGARKSVPGHSSTGDLLGRALTATRGIDRQDLINQVIPSTIPTWDVSGIPSDGSSTGRQPLPGECPLFAFLLAILCSSTCPELHSGEASPCFVRTSLDQLVSLDRTRDGTKLPSLREDRPIASGEALSRESHLPARIESRGSSFDKSLTSNSVTPRVCFPRWRNQPRASGGPFSHPSLQVLFCSWLA